MLTSLKTIGAFKSNIYYSLSSKKYLRILYYRWRDAAHFKQNTPATFPLPALSHFGFFGITFTSMGSVRGTAERPAKRKG